MATRPKATAPGPDTRVAAYIPVNATGEPLGEPEDWRMPAGSDDGSGALVSTLDESEDEPESASERVLALLNDLSGDSQAKLILYRMPGQGKKLTWLDEMPPEDFELGGMKNISQKWGGGDYQIRLFGRHPASGKHCVLGRTMFSLENPRVEIGSVPGHGSELAQVLQQQGEMLRSLLERASAPPAPAPDPMVQMGAMLGVMKTMREAMGLDVAPKQTNGIGDIIKAIKELREVSEIVNPAPAEEGPMGMVTKMLPLIQEAMAQRQQPQQIPVQQRLPNPALRAVPVPQAIEHPPQAQPDSDPDNEAMNPITLITLKAYLSQLAKLATDKAPFEQGAELVYEKLPDEFIELLASDQWFEMLKMAAPEMDVHHEWLLQVRNQVLRMLAEDADEGPDDHSGAGETDRVS